ncbi:AAA family ATPase [Actinotalea sp. K2]|uniref:AAA family ATPase n=1 Tax=Actinotalea sp. K2 TaxID=2939438 RepID=UPI00201733CD|nr:LuxR family transcriptional regulator [Actinotalea sp. K2]MCL3862122.1 AAA family ATPase [Actinotalea sp. K2]
MSGLLGRRAERDTIDQVLARAGQGRSGALVVRGEAGIGKTALLGYAQDSATAAGFRVEQSVGVESETYFAFAALHRLCTPLLDQAGALPDPQQDALAIALGLREGGAPNGFLVGLAVLNLLSEASEAGPLLCLVDDVQWLDHASVQVLAFVARRVEAEGVALVFALRDGPGAGGVPPLVGLPELSMGRLADTDARALLAAEVRTPMDGEVRDRVVAEAHGNPLALLELPRSALRGSLAGGFELPDVMTVPRRVEENFRRRSGDLPAETQLLLLTAAAEPTGDLALLWRATVHLGIPADAAAPAEAAGLLEVGTRVRFRHPLVRSAVYQAAAGSDLRRVHRALAAVTDAQLDPDRRAWHRAQAVLGDDEEVATELERSAGRARARGGSAAAAAFLQRAVELTPGPGRRARRALEAAAATHEAGASEAAGELLKVAARGPLAPLQLARLQLLEAQIAFHLTQGSHVPGMLLAAARALAPLDAALSRQTYLQAIDAANIIGGPGPGPSSDLRAVAEAARDAPPPPGSPGAADLLLDGLVTTSTHGYEKGVPGLRRAMVAFRDEALTRPTGTVDDRRWLWLASRTAVSLFDDDLGYRLGSRNVRLTREAGALDALPAALVTLSATLVWIGEFARAEELATEEAAITRSTGAVPLPYARLMLAAWRGRRADAPELKAAMALEGTAQGTGNEVTFAQYNLAVLHNARGDYAAAERAAAIACQAHEVTHSNLALPEFIEAASRGGHPERAAAALDQLSSRARASGTEWALGLAAQSRALASTGPGAEEHYREAVERLGRCRMAAYRARAHLVFGEWLCREGRAHDARDHLLTAHEMLSDMGAEAFAERAARELRATGEHPRGRTAQPTDALTAQELHIARIVATGGTSREVGAQLFLSPRTIETHLRNIFRKLGITSRQQLGQLRLP